MSQVNEPTTVLRMETGSEAALLYQKLTEPRPFSEERETGISV